MNYDLWHEKEDHDFLHTKKKPKREKQFSKAEDKFYESSVVVRDYSPLRLRDIRVRKGEKVLILNSKPKSSRNSKWQIRKSNGKVGFVKAFCVKKVLSEGDLPLTA